MLAEAGDQVEDLASPALVGDGDGDQAGIGRGAVPLGEVQAGQAAAVAVQGGVGAGGRDGADDRQAGAADDDVAGGERPQLAIVAEGDQGGGGVDGEPAAGLGDEAEPRRGVGVVEAGGNGGPGGDL